MKTPGLALAAVLALPAGGASATDFDPAHATSTAALPWRNAPAEVDSFAGVVATGATRSWAPPPAALVAPPIDTFDADAARRAAIDPPAPSPGGGDMTSVADSLNGIIPVPEPSIATLLLSGLCALGLIGFRRRLH